MFLQVAYQRRTDKPQFRKGEQHHGLYACQRTVGVSHLALGTVRVMRTCAMEGEVIGMAADICRRKDCLPRQVYLDHFEELKQLMEKGAGDATKPYLQTYTLIDTTAERSENC